MFHLSLCKVCFYREILYKILTETNCVFIFLYILQREMWEARALQLDEYLTFRRVSQTKYLERSDNK